MALTKVSTPAIKDEAITLAKLLHGDANSDGKFLRANNGADPSFETVSIPAGTTINNNADDRLITGSGTANTLNGESALTFNGTLLKLQVDSGEFRIESANGVDQLSVDSDNGNTFINGTVGIGEASPARKLSVSGGTFPALRLKNTTTSIANGTNICGIEFEHADSSAPGVCAGIIAQMADTSTGGLHMRFLTGPNVNLYQEMMRIDMSGHVGIGKSSPNIGSHTKTLTVSDVGTGSRAAVEIEGNTANCHAALEFYKNGTLVSGLNSRGSDRLQFICGSSGTVRGQFTPNGLNFGSDTAADNALNDYEEGTWTPFVMYYYNGAWYATTMTSVGTKSAKYTKIGDLVFVDLEWHSWEVQNANYALISGLPFTCTSRGHFTQCYTNAFNSNQNQGGLISSNSTYIEFYRDNNSWNAIKNNSSNLYIYGAGVYKAS
jgi:hypothetical protein